MKIKLNIEDLEEKVKALEQENIRYKRVEKKVRENIELYELLLEDITDIIAHHSPDGTILYVSPSVTSILGYEPAELIGTDGFNTIIHPDDLQKIQSKIIEVLEKGHSYDRIEHRMLSKSGDYVWVESTGRLKTDTNNKESFEIISVTREITERKQIEKAQKKYKAELEQRVKERTLALQKNNQELTTKKRELEELNSALKVLLKKREEDKIEHEERVLSNLKILVEPYLEKLQKSSLNEKQKTYLKIIQTNLNDIISPFVRNFSSIYYNLTPQEIQIADLVKQGKTNKEIANVMSLSLKTIEFHRTNIRKKLGLKTRKANLRAYLMSHP